MIFGTFVGGMADRRGRKKYAIYFCYFYGLSCLSKRKSISSLHLCVTNTEYFIWHITSYVLLFFPNGFMTDFNNFWILLFGRMVGGISTSLLFSVFESWFIKAHANEKLDKVGSF